MRTFCLNPDHLSSLKVLYLIWFNILGWVWSLKIEVWYQTILQFLSVCQSLVLGCPSVRPGTAHCVNCSPLIFCHGLLACLRNCPDIHGRLAVLSQALYICICDANQKKKCFEQDVLFWKATEKQEHHPFFLIPNINRSAPFLVGITGMSGSCSSSPFFQK